MDPQPDQKKRILVVDDEPAILTFVRIGLKRAGYDVITATNGAEALELTKSASPDLMLLDMVLPGISGLEVLRRLRADSTLPVIVFSAHDSLPQQALGLGANGAIAKPFHPDQLREKIQALLATP